MVLGHQTPTLTHFLTARRIDTRHIALLVTKTIPLLRRMRVFVFCRRAFHVLALELHFLKTHKSFLFSHETHLGPLAERR